MVETTMAKRHTRNEWMDDSNKKCIIITESPNVSTKRKTEKLLLPLNIIKSKKLLINKTSKWNALRRTPFN